MRDMNFSMWIRLDEYCNINPKFEAIKAFSNSDEMNDISKNQRKDVYHLLEAWTE